MKSVVDRNFGLRGCLETFGEGGWPGRGVIPDGCRSQSGQPHVDPGHGEPAGLDVEEHERAVVGATGEIKAGDRHANVSSLVPLT